MKRPKLYPVTSVQNYQHVPYTELYTAYMMYKKSKTEVITI